MSAFKPKVAETYVYTSQEETPVRIVVVIPEEVEAPEFLEFVYAATQDSLEVRDFQRDHAGTVVARQAILQQIAARENQDA